MRHIITGTILGLLFIVANVNAYSSFYGVVYKGSGTSERAGYTFVSALGEDSEYKTTFTNASGEYQLWGLTGGQYYELYACKEYNGQMWTDWAFIYLPPNISMQHDFHLHPGYPPKR